MVLLIGTIVIYCLCFHSGRYYLLNLGLTFLFHDGFAALLIVPFSVLMHHLLSTSWILISPGSLAFLPLLMLLLIFHFDHLVHEYHHDL